MHRTSSQFVSLLLAAVVVWSVYLRLRRSFGRQLFFVPHTYTGLAVSLLFSRTAGLSLRPVR
jgi:hypothetical protein